MKETESDDDLDLVKEAVEQLSRHFDTVQIFATRVSPKEGGTVNIRWGDGNWFARYGQISHWLKITDATEGDEAIKDANEEEDD